MKRLVILTLVALIVPVSAHADFFEKVGTFGAQFLEIGTTARATAMGSAFTAVADDASSVFWNPAGLVEVRSSEVQVSHVDWPADIKLTSAIMAFNPHVLPGTFAFSIRSLWLDPMVVRTAYEPEGNGQEFDAGSTAFALSYGRFFTDKFSAGITTSYIHMGLAEDSVNTVSFDFGILYRIGIRDLKLGMVIQNYGGKINFDELEAKMPVNFKVGGSFNAFKSDNQVLLCSAEFQHPSDNAERTNFGLEWGMRNMFFARAGYNAGYDTDGLAFGFGTAISTGKNSRAMVDYSAVDMQDLDWVHRVSISFSY